MEMTMRALAFAVSFVAAAGQLPSVQGGQVETERSSDPAASVKGVGAGSEAVWVLWSVPMVGGERNLCSTWSRQTQSTRGMYLEGWSNDGLPTFAPPPAGPMAIEAGTRLVVLARVLEGAVERLRTVADDCPIDAGGRRLVRLEGVTPEASLRYLESFLTPATGPTTDTHRSLRNSALAAIALHGSGAADAVLERFLSANIDSDAGRQAASWLTRARGRRGFEVVLRLIGTVTTPAAQRNLVAALAQSPQPETFDTLVRLARTSTNERIRTEAVRAISVSTDPRARVFLEEVLR